MRTNARISGDYGKLRPAAFAAIAVLAWAASPATAQTESRGAPASSVEIPSDSTVESLFTDFLHYARMGRFDTADAYARALLAHPDLDPVKVLEVANKDKEGIGTLLTLIKSSTIGENAAQILDLIQQG